MSETNTLLKVGQRVRVTPQNAYANWETITVGGLGTVVGVTGGTNYPYLVRYDQLSMAHLLTKSEEIEAVDEEEE
jgi:hypothetical protein